MTTAVSAGVIEVKKMVRSRNESYFKDVEKAMKRDHPHFTPDELNPISLFEINYDYPENFDSLEYRKGWNSTVAKDWKKQLEELNPEYQDEWEVKQPFTMDKYCAVHYEDQLRFVPRLKGDRKEIYEEEYGDGERELPSAEDRESVYLAKRYKSWEKGWFSIDGHATRIDNWSYLWPEWEGKSRDYVRGAMEGGGYVSQGDVTVAKNLGIYRDGKHSVVTTCYNAPSLEAFRDQAGFVCLVDGEDGGPYGKTSFAVTLLRTVICYYGLIPTGKVQKFQLVNTLEDYTNAVKELGPRPKRDKYGEFEGQVPHVILFDDIDEFAWSGRKVSDRLQKILKVASGYGICTIATAARFSELSPRIQQTIKHVYRVKRGPGNIATKPGEFPIDLREEDWHSFDNHADKTLNRLRQFSVLHHNVKVSKDGKVSVTPNESHFILRIGARVDAPKTYLSHPFFEVSDDPAYMYLQKLKADSLDAILEDGVEAFGNTEEVERKGRNDVIKKLVDSGVITQKELADGVGLHASQISRIVNE